MAGASLGLEAIVRTPAHKAVTKLAIGRATAFNAKVKSAAADAITL